MARVKKLMNDAGSMLDESLDGFAAAYAQFVTLGPDRQFVRRRDLVAGKVALISGGGSGHEPMHIGFVGHGMLDAACPGRIFTSPTPHQIVAAAEAVDTGAGCLFIVKNYDGDVMNFEMAREMSARRVEILLVKDDVATEDSDQMTGRRGVAGTLVVEKCVGAAAEQGADLTALRELGERVNHATRTMGVALSSCTLPAAKRSTFQLADEEIEMGVGIHGEPGRWRGKMGSADAIARDMITAILQDMTPEAGAQVLLMVNGYGGTPLMELHVMVDSANRILRGAGIVPSRFLTGTYVTSLEMAGCSITLTLLDDEIARLWDAPVFTSALRWGNADAGPVSMNMISQAKVVL